MKYLFLLLISFPVFACNNFIPYSEAVKAIAMEPNAGSKQCADLPDEQCFCYDNVDFTTSVLIDEVDDTTGIYTGKKLLRHSPVKQMEKEALELAEKEAEVIKANNRKNACAHAKTFKKTDLTSNAKTVDALMVLLECLK